MALTFGDVETIKGNLVVPCLKEMASKVSDIIRDFKNYE